MCLKFNYVLGLNRIKFNDNLQLLFHSNNLIRRTWNKGIIIDTIKNYTTVLLIQPAPGVTIS